LVRKFAVAQQHLGSLTPAAAAASSAAAAVWDEDTWCKLFVLLADNPPRDLQPGEVTFLRSLPMFRRLQVQQQLFAANEVPAVPQEQQQQQDDEDEDGWLQDDLLLQGSNAAGAAGGGAAGAAGGGAAAAVPARQLVVLGGDSRWVLAPQAVVQECQGEDRGSVMPVGLRHCMLK
jgi:hypothetical protein